MKRRRELEVFSMSFLDAICCGFGSIILLFITLLGARMRLERQRMQVDELFMSAAEAGLED